MLKSLFERKFLVDERDPVGTIEGGGLQLSFFAPDPLYILQLLSVSLQSSVSSTEI
jgi:hypothetical protein